MVHDPRKWMHTRSDDEDDENDEDRSLDLLVRFVQSVFKKVSKRTRKAVRSVLPFPISTHLVGLLDLFFCQFYRDSASLDFFFGGMKFNISFNTGGIFCEWDTVADLPVDFEGVSSGTVFIYL